MAGIAVAKRKDIYHGRRRGTTKAKLNRAICQGLTCCRDCSGPWHQSIRTIERYLRTG